MWKMRQEQRTRGGCALFLGVMLWSAGAMAEAGSNGKACAVFPVADLEAHFGAKATPLKGSDMSTMSMCSANFPDVRHQASVNMKPPSPAEDAMSIEDTL